MLNWASRAVLAPTIAALLVLSGPAARGDDTPAVKVGARVRAYVSNWPSGQATGSKRVTGALLGFSETTITIDEAEEDAPLVLPRQNVTRLELSLRRGRRGKGAAIGFAAGLAAGLAIGLAAGNDGPNCWFMCLNATEKGALSALLLGPTAAAIGAAVAPGEQWQIVPTDRIRVGPSAMTSTTPKPTVSITLRF